jgi:hypothetical protein
LIVNDRYRFIRSGQTSPAFLEIRRLCQPSKRNSKNPADFLLGQVEAIRPGDDANHRGYLIIGNGHKIVEATKHYDILGSKADFFVSFS